MIYDIPLASGMEFERRKEGIRLPSGNNTKILNDSESRENIVYQIACRSKKGTRVPARELVRFYDQHFTALGFRKWGDEDALSGRYQAPSLVTKGEARVWTRGHISYHIPEGGDFIVFWIEQTREPDVLKSSEKIGKLRNAFSHAAKDSGFTYEMPENSEISDWDEYVINECFVHRFISYIDYKEEDVFSMGDDGNFRFYFTVFPTKDHAVQWRDRILQNIADRSPYPNYLRDGLALAPTVVDNIVVEYKGDTMDVQNPALKLSLVEALKRISEEYGGN